MLRAGHGVYFNRVVPMIGGALSDKAAYSYLPRSMAYLPAARRDGVDAREAGFPDAERRQLSGGLTQLLVGTRS